MNRSVTHATFTLERTYETSAERVFTAWADPKAKAEWFGPAEEFEFRVGGREHARNTFDEVTFTFEADYQDIIQNERIVYSYIMRRDGQLLSVSLATIELRPADAGDGTLLIVTEQGAYLDGLDTPEQREAGTAELLDALGAALRGPADGG